MTKAQTRKIVAGHLAAKGSTVRGRKARMTKAEIRSLVAQHLAELGYIREHYGWDDRHAECNVMVRDKIAIMYLPTKQSVEDREKEFRRIPRRGPARPLPALMKDDGGGMQLDWILEGERR